jgi:hypothetical protein
MIKRVLPLLAICLLILAATAAGILYRSNEPNITLKSLRGQESTFLGGGLYRYNPVYFAREGVIWDVVNLAVGLPLLILASIFALRNSLRGRLLLGGLLAYFWYVYLGASLMYAFNGFFLVYIAIFALCSVAFFQNLAQIDTERLIAHFGAGFPHRTFIIYSSLIAGLLIVLWVGRVVQVMQTGLLPKEYAGMHTLGSQALDLGLLVPLAISTAVLLGKRSDWGYYLSSVTITIGFMMFISISAWIVVPLMQDGKTNLLEAIPFFIVSAVGIVLAIIYYARVQEVEEGPSGS